MDASACLNILASRPTPDYPSLAAERPPNLPSPQSISLDTGTVQRHEERTAASSENATANAPTPQEAHKLAVAAQVLTINHLEVAGVIKSFMKSQEQRVAAYSEFEKKFRTMLTNRSFTAYPEAIASATGKFSILSAEAKAAIQVLAEKGASEASKLAARIQALEGEKLTLTAALHLDKIRRRNLPIEDGALLEELEDPSEELTRAVTMVDQSLATIQENLTTCVLGINEALGDLLVELGGGDY